MRKPLTIAQKIWLILGILIAGYFISVSFGFILGRNWESRLNNVSEDLFPASLQSRAALSAFDEQIDLYNDIVMIGNIGDFIISSLNKENEVQDALQNILKLKKIDEASLNRTREVKADLKRFSATARSVYAKIKADDSYVFNNAERPREDLEGEIFIIGQRTGRLRERLASLHRIFSDELKGEVANINIAARHYRYVNMAMFLFVAGFVGMVVWIVISRSVSRTEKDLRESKHMLERTINSLNEAVFIIDSETERIMDCNRAAEKIFKYRRKDIIGKAWLFLYPDAESFREFESGMYPAVERNGFFELNQFQMKSEDGRIFLTDHSVVPLKDHLDKRIAWVSVVRDISDRKRLEDQLRQAQKMEAVGTLAGGIAHDFNNILFPVIGYTEMALNDLDNTETVRSYINQVLKAAYRARDLVQQILTLSRHREYDRKPVKVHYIIKEALKLLRSTLPVSIEIRESIEDCGRVMADAGQIHQVIMNLCTNALHAMPDRKGILEITMENIDLGSDDWPGFPGLEPGNYIKLVISDTGCGMSSEVRERIFEPYFTTKEQGKGTGLGLSVVHGIVKDHQGYITVYSEPGKGTSFHIYLPTTGIDSFAEETPDPVGPVPTGNENILLVDDEKMILEMETRMLEQLGYRVTARSRGAEALKVFQDRPDMFDLVITDMNMPDMTGMDLAQDLIRLRREIPIILCTGFSEVVTKEKSEIIGISEFMMKPVVRRHMAETIRKVLENRKGGEMG